MVKLWINLNHKWDMVNPKWRIRMFLGLILPGILLFNCWFYPPLVIAGGVYLLALFAFRFPWIVCGSEIAGHY
jgi:hypothetical protein